MADDPKTPITDALDSLNSLPAEEIRAGIVVKDGDAGALVEARKDIGKPGGWEASAEASWMKRAGWMVKGLITWKKS